METDLALWVHLKGIIGIAIGVFMVIVFFTSGLSESPSKPSMRIPEYIDTGIGFREPAPPPVRANHDAELQALRAEIQQLKQQKQQPRQRPQQQQKPKKVENPIIQDCVNALEGLGEKRSVARATVSKYFVNNPNTNSVEDFLSGVFKR